MATNDPFEVDPTPDSPDEEANKLKLSEYLSNYEKALEEEWREDNSYKEGTLPPEQIRTKTKELLTQAVPKAVASLLYMAQHAANEQVRVKAATYIIDKAIGKETGFVGDPMEELLRSINES